MEYKHRSSLDKHYAAHIMMILDIATSACLTPI